MTNAYALPPRVAVLGATYEEARQYIARRWQELEEAGLEPVAVSAAGHPGSIAGMVVARIVVTAGASKAPTFEQALQTLQRGAARGKTYYEQGAE